MAHRHSRSAKGFGPPLPGAVSGFLTTIGQSLGLVRRRDQSFHRFGIVLDTHRAAEELGFEPQYRIEIRGRARARRIDTVRCR